MAHLERLGEKGIVSGHQKISADLRPGEELLWCEEPAPLALLVGKKSFWPIIFFTGFFALIYFATPGQDGGNWFFGFFAIFVLGSFLYDVISAFRTLYGITTSRLIILQPSLSATVIESYYPPDIDFVKKTRRKSGGGDIVFAAIKEQGGKRTVTVSVGFFGIDDVDAIESMILKLRSPKNA